MEYEKSGILKLLAIFKKCFQNVFQISTLLSVLIYFCTFYHQMVACSVVANGSWLESEVVGSIPGTRCWFFSSFCRARKETKDRVGGPAQSSVNPVRRAAV